MPSQRQKKLVEHFYNADIQYIPAGCHQQPMDIMKNT